MTVYEPDGKAKVKRKHTFTSLKLRRISGVDRPAQEGATAVLLMKRADEDPRSGARVLPGMVRVEAGDLAITQKGYVADRPALTSTVNGHTHIVDVSSQSGYTSWEGVDDDAHAHPYVVSEGGQVVIGESNGHTHTVEVMAAKAAEHPTGEPMSNTDPKATEPTPEERIADLEKRLAEQTALASMTDGERAHLATLKGADAEAFRAATPEQRAATVEAAKAADAVVYKAADGTVYRKSDDARVVELAKRSDTFAAEAAKAREERELEVLKARAGREIPHLPGSEDARVALLKAVDSIADEKLRGEVLASIKASDAGLGEAFKRAGVGGQPAEDSPEAKLDALAKKHAQEKGMTFERAYAEVAKSAEGSALFAAAAGTSA